MIKIAPEAMYAMRAQVFSRRYSCQTSTMTDQTHEKKSRGPNFSASDCLILSEILGTDCGKEGKTFHGFVKHKFTDSKLINIEKTSKKHPPVFLSNPPTDLDFYWPRSTWVNNVGHAKMSVVKYSASRAINIHFDGSWRNVWVFI